MVLALPAIPLVIIALAALLMAWALRDQIGRFLIAILQAIPVVGGAAADLVSRAGAVFGTWLGQWIVGLIAPLIAFLDFTIGTATIAVRWATSAANYVGFTLRLALSTIAVRIAAVQAQLALANDRITHTVASIVTLGGRVTTVAAQLGIMAATTIPLAVRSAVSQAVARAQALAEAARLAAVAAVNAALAVALRAVGNEAAARVAADTAGRAWAAAVAATVRSSLLQQLAAAEAARMAAQAATAGAIAGTNARIGPLAWPTVAIGLTTIATALETMRRQCVQPTCNYLGRQLGALELAEDALMLAAVSGIVVSAVRDPQGTARQTVATTAPYLGAVNGLLNEIAGIHL